MGGWIWRRRLIGVVGQGEGSFCKVGINLGSIKIWTETSLILVDKITREYLRLFTDQLYIRYLIRIATKIRSWIRTRTPKHSNSTTFTSEDSASPSEICSITSKYPFKISCTKKLPRTPSTPPSTSASPWSRTKTSKYTTPSPSSTTSAGNTVGSIYSASLPKAS